MLQARLLDDSIVQWAQDNHGTGLIKLEGG